MGKNIIFQKVVQNHAKRFKKLVIAHNEDKSFFSIWAHTTPTTHNLN